MMHPGVVHPIEPHGRGARSHVLAKISLGVGCLRRRRSEHPNAGQKDNNGSPRKPSHNSVSLQVE